MPFRKRFTVFNLDQCEDLPRAIAPALVTIEHEAIEPHARALIAATGARLRIGSNYAFYSPLDDLVVIPPPESFFAPIDWHRTAFHELAHWTGHGARLARDQSGLFGSGAYVREELVAEMAGAFVCAALGIEPTVRHADYLGDWLRVLREDSHAIVRAASAASRAADYLLAFGTLPAASPGKSGQEGEARGRFATG